MKLITIYWVLLFFIFGVCCSQRVQLIPFEENGLWGYKNQKGAVVIRPKYFVANEFLETGIAAVADSAGWIYIDRAGYPVIRPFVFDNGPDYFSEGLARYQSEDKVGFFDHRGHIVIPAQWNYARPFSGGMAAVCEGCAFVKEDEYTRISGGKWGFIDKTGTVVIPLHFEKVRDFSGAHVEIYSEGQWKIIDKNGMFIPN